MKKSIVALIAFAFLGTAFAEAEKKQVCIDKTDAKGQVMKDKNGKPVQVCKTIKVHKKLDGTPVPEKK